MSTDPVKLANARTAIVKATRIAAIEGHLIEISSGRVGQAPCIVLRSLAGFDQDVALRPETTLHVQIFDEPDGTPLAQGDIVAVEGVGRFGAGALILASGAHINAGGPTGGLWCVVSVLARPA